MTQSNTKNLYNKWQPIIDQIGSTSSDCTSKGISQSLGESDSFTLLPMSMKIASKTIGMDLVSVQPLSSPSTGNHDEISKEVKSINRDAKIESIINDVEYKEMKTEDHPDYKPDGIFYMDYRYGGSTPSNVI